MTKKPSEKNKAWEKERRDRLNKSFDSLAKLLPNYDPSVVWTKIEIIQKSILYIEVLQQRNKKYLATKDPQELKKYNELIDAIKYFQSRNGQLSELLKKSKIALPPLILPKYLCDNTKLIESNQKEQNELKDSDQSEKFIKEDNKNCKDETLETYVVEKKVKLTKIKTIKQNTKVDDTKLKTVRTITVTSTVKPDVLVADEEKVQNIIPSSATNVSINKDSSQNQSNILLSNNPPVPSPILPAILPTLIKIENLPFNKKIKKFNANQIIRKFAKDQNGKIKILPQPHLKLYYRRADGKMPIPVIRKKIIVPVKKRKPRKKRKIINDDGRKCDAKKIKLNEKNKNVESNDETEKVNNDENCKTKTEKNIFDIKRTNLNVLDVEKNTGTVSPTAAFLESFPVVASTTNLGKLCETQNAEQVDVLPKIYEISKTADSNAENFENLNNFFATNEYNNYCTQTKENIKQDSNKLNDTKLENQETLIEFKSSSNLKKPEIQILENIKIEINKSIVSRENIKTDNETEVTTTILNKNLTIASIPQVTTTNISNTNSLFTIFPPITVNPLTLPSTSYSSTPSTLNLISYISTPSTIFSSSTQFLSNFPEFSHSIAKKPSIKRNSCKFNLSTKGPICTPLPLDSKNFITQNYSASSNCRLAPTNIPKTFSQTSLDNFNISKTGSSDVNYNPLIATSSLSSTNILPVQNNQKTFINTSTSIDNTQNIITAETLPTHVSAALECNKTLPLTINSKNMPNFQNYQTSFENFNLKTYSAATNVTPETSKNSVENIMKISKNSKSLINVVNSKVSDAYTKIFSSSANISSTNSNMPISGNLYPGISTLNQTFVNINSSNNQISSSNLTSTTAFADLTANLCNSKTIKTPINSLEKKDKNVYSNLKSNLSQFNPYSATVNIPNSYSMNSSIQSDKTYVTHSSSNFIPSTITSNTISSLTYSYCTNSSIPTNVKSQSTKFHPYAANFGIPTITTINTTTNLTYSTSAGNVSNYATKSFVNHISSNNSTISNTNVTYTTGNSITMTTKSIETEKNLNSNLSNRFLNTKTTENTSYQPFNRTLESNIIPSSTNSQFVLRPYDFLTNTTTSISTASTVNYIPAISYTTTKQMILPTTYTFTTCTSSGSNYSNTTYTNLTTVNHNNYSVGNSVYSNPAKNYYYPLQTETSTTFSFSLTTTTNSQTKPLITAQSPSILTYQNIKSEMPPPWIPAPGPTPVTVTTDYKTPFTFSLTPATTILTTTTVTKSSSCILNTTSTSNPQIPLNSYNSATNFTFCLTTPKSVPPLDANGQKLKTYQTNYPIYNTSYDSQLNFNQKDTTNFTFALTKSTNSVIDIKSTPTIIPNNKFDNLYTDSNLDNKNKQEITIQNTATVTAEHFKVNANKLKTNGQKLNKKNISQISGNEQKCYDCEQNKSCGKVNHKSHVNWMTSSSENTSNSKITQQYFPVQHNEINHTWSPNKIYDNNLQQTYYGDYTNYPINSNQNLNNSKFCNIKNEKYVETIPPISSTTNQSNNNNNNNFFSVSQLVDQSSVSSKNFTNTQNFNQTSCQHSKISPTKSRTTKDMKIENQTNNNLLNLDYSEQQQREQKPLSISNTYSAEALISKKEKHRNFNPTNCNNNNNNNLINPTDFYSSSIDQLETIACDQNNYHTNNYFYNYHHHQQSINHQNYPIQSEIDYLGSGIINSYENEEYNKTILNKIDKKLYPPTSYPPPIPPAPPPPPSAVPPLSTSNPVNNTNVSTFLPYDTNYGHIQYYHGSTTTITTSSSANSTSNYQQASNWTKGLHYTNSSCVVPQYHHSQQILTPIITDHHHVQSAINSQPVTGNLTNFNLSSICPEINDKVNSSGTTNNEW